MALLISRGSYLTYVYHDINTKGGACFMIHRRNSYMYVKSGENYHIHHKVCRQEPQSNWCVTTLLLSVHIVSM